MCKGSITTTNDVCISVHPEFVPSEEAAEGEKFLFLYRIEIQNLGTQTIQLLSRYWLIINGEGTQDEVAGAGVVGYTPILKPGDSFIYTSYCPLDTNWGTMEGHFTFINEDKIIFDAKIDRFYLAV